MPDFIQYFLFVGFAGLMLLMRLDARRFGAAEWDTEDGDGRVWLSRLTWYAAGLALGLTIFALHPSPASELNLVFAPDRGGALLLGLIYGAGGIAAAFALAIITHGRVSFPHPARYPGGVLNAVGTAFFDEFLFRGVMLGLLLSLGLPDWMAVSGAALIYVGAIRASTGGRGLLALLASLAIGLVGGVLVLLTAGIAAAFMGHAVTRFALFMTMGYPVIVEAGAVLRPGHVVGVGGATGDSRAWLIPPRGKPRGGEGDDGRGGIGPVRPA
jgi:hypothetical protein